MTLTLKSLAASSSSSVASCFFFSLIETVLAAEPSLASLRAFLMASFPSPGRLFPRETRLVVNKRVVEAYEGDGAETLDEDEDEAEAEAASEVCPARSDLVIMVPGPRSDIFGCLLLLLNVGGHFFPSPPLF